MRKLSVLFLAVLLLGTGAALAQSGQWAGVSFGGGIPFAGSVNLHFGLNDVIGDNIDVRANGTVSFFGVFGLGADVLIGLPIDTGDLPLEVYAGGGPALAFGGGGFAAGANLLAGAEFRLGDVGLDQGGVFFEAGPGLTFVPVFLASFVAKLGFNYHF